MMCTECARVFLHEAGVTKKMIRKPLNVCVHDCCIRCVPVTRIASTTSETRKPAQEAYWHCRRPTLLVRMEMMKFAWIAGFL